jgi:hypothetical protein
MHILYYIYVTCMINCHLIILHVLYKQLNPQINDGYIMCIYTHYVVGLTHVLFPFFLYMHDYVVLDNGYRIASGYVGGLDPGDA